MTTTIKIGEWGNGCESGWIVCSPEDEVAVRVAYDAIDDDDISMGALDAVIAAGGRWVIETEDDGPSGHEISSNIYISSGEWCYATRVDGEHDDSDSLGLDATSSQQEAEQAVRELYAHLGGTHTVQRVSDC